MMKDDQVNETKGRRENKKGIKGKKREERG